MNRRSRDPQADPLYGRPLAERPHYATGTLLDAQDFADEQTYHRGRLASALALLAGGGTLAGLGTSHSAPVAGPDGRPEEIRVEPGVAVDRLGRLIEVPRPACLRLGRWFDGEAAADGGDRLRRAAYTDLDRFLSARAIAEAGTEGRPAVPARGVVADVFVRFVACATGLTPSFASGPFDALDAVATSRVRDAYELTLVARDGLDDEFDGLPAPGPNLAAIADLTERRARLQDSILASYPVRGRAGRPGGLEPMPEHPNNVDPSAVFLARVLIPIGAADPPAREGAAVVVDNWRRRFVASALLLARWAGA
jgi:hypothetical protein